VGIYAKLGFVCSAANGSKKQVEIDSNYGLRKVIEALMDLLEAIYTRRTVHKYLPDAIPQETLDRILMAGHYAPNHKLTWPWRFTQVGTQTRQKLVPVAVACKAAKRELSDDMKAAITAKIVTPGALIVVSQLRSDNEFQSKEDYAAVSCAIQNMMLAAHGEGLGAKWSSGGVTTHADTYAVLGIEPDLEEIAGFVWVGVPAKVPTIKRPDLAEVTRELP
jgi:nitroreductase